MSLPLSLAYIGQVCLIADPAQWAAQSNSIFSEPRAPLTFCEPVVIPDDYTIVEGIGAYKVHTQATYWNDARHSCEDEGAHLAVINSDEEANALVTLIEAATDSGDFSFLGYHDLYEKEDFVTIYGTSLENTGFTTWADVSDDEDTENLRCGSFVNAEGKLKALNCNEKLSYVCELDDPHVSW